jgi:hypothetical protein
MDLTNVLGDSDAGAHVVLEEPALQRQMEAVGKELHVRVRAHAPASEASKASVTRPLPSWQPHTVADASGATFVLPAAADVEGHLGTDGR